MSAVEREVNATLRRMQEELDTTRAKLAEAEAERDEARTLAARRNEIAADWMREHGKKAIALAAAQADNARLREALAAAEFCMDGDDNMALCPLCTGDGGGHRQHTLDCIIGNALVSTAQGDTSAMSSAFAPRTDKMMHFIHDTLYGVGGLEDLVAHEMPMPKCVERHDTDTHLGRWACDAAEWVLDAATRHPEIMAALNERAAERAARETEGGEG